MNKQEFAKLAPGRVLHREGRKTKTVISSTPNIKMFEDRYCTKCKRSTNGENMARVISAGKYISLECVGCYLESLETSTTSH